MSEVNGSRLCLFQENCIYILLNIFSNSNQSFWSLHKSTNHGHNDNIMISVPVPGVNLHTLSKISFFTVTS